MEKKRNHQKRKGKVGSSNGGGNALQKGNKEALGALGNCSESDEFYKIQKRSMRALWKHMDQRESVWNHLYEKIMKITSQAKDTIQ